jgi:hypothetical protein
MFLKYIYKSICLGFLVGLIVYVSSKLIGTEVNSTVIGAATAVVVAAINLPKLLSANQKSAKPL